ncbi:MAG: hypothetical protein JRN15_08600 [Nitrososphaerota archaeon]|nr:hypothetical protein [Nitrososphaerota archaeon]
MQKKTVLFFEVFAPFAVQSSIVDFTAASLAEVTAVIDFNVWTFDQSGDIVQKVPA